MSEAEQGGAAGFGARVLEARLRLSLKRRGTVSQTDIGRELGVTGVSVGRWEAGLSAPDLLTIEKLAAVLEVDPRWLAFGDPDAARSDATRTETRRGTVGGSVPGRRPSASHADKAGGRKA